MTQMRELPHDLIAERSLIGSLLVDSDAFDQITDLRLKAEDFYNPQYGIIFNSITDLTYSRQPIDYVTVTSRLNELGKLEEIGGSVLSDHFQKKIGVDKTEVV